MKAHLATLFVVGIVLCLGAAYAELQNHVLGSLVAAALPSTDEAMISFKTAGGTLLCAKDLCITTRQPAPAGEQPGGLRSSEHLVRLAQKDAPIVLQCDEAQIERNLCMPVRHHDYGAAGAALSGARLIVPGDGCLYATDIDSSQTRTMRRYCATADGILVDRGYAGVSWPSKAPGA
ncbi:hypothetical protein AWB78_08219 [Caballeronia calidae]|uniref:Uncharacterized protein n=1 Tax=Caballeronia calidae TaxID=1777139 RepID=A0A158EIM6_9BURK|nr:hypothetical protein [Caballeronia calidae]SAL06735.1 hypothetical protein AWB78_08219 [Caballeronia calidae]